MKKNFALLACVSIFALSACSPSEKEQILAKCKSDAADLASTPATKNGDYDRVYSEVLNGCISRSQKK
jgi:protein involved in sex pheromone biosynthesis